MAILMMKKINKKPDTILKTLLKKINGIRQ